MRIYLDTCSLQRPLDDKSQIRIQLEAEAIFALLTLCKERHLEIVSSEVLEIELRKNPHPQRRVYVTEILAMAALFVEVSNTIKDRAKQLEGIGFKGMDALHLAAAEDAQVDYFCSCDDRLVRRAKSTNRVMVKVVTPLELAGEIIE